MAKLSTQEIIDAIKELSVLELNDLVKACEEEFGVSAAAGVVVAAAVPNLQMSLLMIYTALRFLTLMQSVSLKKLTLYLCWINFKTTKLYLSVLRRT